MAFIEQEGGGGNRVVIVRPGRHSYRVEVDTRPPGNLVLTERQRKLLTAAELRQYRNLPLSDQLRVQRELADALVRRHRQRVRLRQEANREARRANYRRGPATVWADPFVGLYGNPMDTIEPLGSGLPLHRRPRRAGQR